VTRYFHGYHEFDLVSLTLFDLHIKNFNLGHYFCLVSTRALIFHMSIPCDKTFLRVPTFCYPVTLTLVFDLLIGNFNLDYIF
jgi:hypothetical protein